MACRLVDVQTVDARCAFIGTYPFERPLQVLSRQRCLQQRRPCVFRLTPRAAGFVADGYTRGFTARYSRPPRLRGHLTHGLPHRHVGLHSLSFGPSPAVSASPAQPLTTTTSADFSLRLSTSPFQAQGEISPGKNALLHCTTAGFTTPRLDHESFAVFCPLALLGTAFYPVLVHRLAVALHASFPHSVTLMQLRFASFAVINSREDLHLQECAHAGRTEKSPRGTGG